MLNKSVNVGGGALCFNVIFVKQRRYQLVAADILCKLCPKEFSATADNDNARKLTGKLSRGDCHGIIAYLGQYKSFFYFHSLFNLNNAAILNGDIHSLFDVLEELLAQRVDNRHFCAVALEPYVSQNNARACKRVDRL